MVALKASNYIQVFSLDTLSQMVINPLGLNIGFFSVGEKRFQSMKSNKIIYCLAVTILTLSSCATKSYETGVSSEKIVEAGPPAQKHHVKIA